MILLAKSSLPILAGVPKPQNVDAGIAHFVAQLIVTDNHAPYIAGGEFFERDA